MKNEKYHPQSISAYSLVCYLDALMWKQYFNIISVEKIVTGKAVWIEKNHHIL